MAEIFEALMVICFGISWPVSIVKSWKSETAKGKSLVFLGFILIGYLCGMISKIIAGKITYVFVFYVLNFMMVSIDLCLYFRNTKLDRQREKTPAGGS